jgi:hypothetical protein
LALSESLVPDDTPNGTVFEKMEKMEKIAKQQKFLPCNESPC